VNFYVDGTLKVTATPENWRHPGHGGRSEAVRVEKSATSLITSAIRGNFWTVVFVLFPLLF
jgi:hypothetical protein